MEGVREMSEELLREDIENILRLLEDCEWADCLPKTPLGERLWNEINALHNDRT